MKFAYTISRTSPSTRLSMVAAAVAPEDFSICDMNAHNVPKRERQGQEANGAVAWRDVALHSLNPQRRQLTYSFRLKSAGGWHVHTS